MLQDAEMIVDSCEEIMDPKLKHAPDRLLAAQLLFHVHVAIRSVSSCWTISAQTA